MLSISNKISSLITAIERTTISDIIANDTQHYVPVDKGNLRNSLRVTDRTISWGDSMAPYAKYVYYIPKNHNSPTCDHWVDKSVSINKDEWVRKLKDRILENAGLDPGFNE